MEPSLVVIGVNFKTAPDAMRERFVMGESRRSDALQSLVRSEGIEEAIVLATNTRTEFVVWASDAAEAANSVLRLLTREYDLKLSEWSNFFRLLDEEALLHIFRMVSGLESGEGAEPEIVPQVSDAWRTAQRAGTTGRCLDAVMQKALEVSEGVGGKARGTAEEMVQCEAPGFRQKLATEFAAPTVMALRSRLDEICRQELKNLGEQFGPFTEDQKQTLNKLAAHITQRIAGSLARELKDLSGPAEQEVLTAAVQRLFQLEMQIPSVVGKH